MHYKIEIAHRDIPYGYYEDKTYNVVKVTDKYWHYFNGMETFEADEIIIGTFSRYQHSSNKIVCINVYNGIKLSNNDKEQIKEAILEYFTYTESYTEKVKHESSKWVKPTYKIIKVEGEHETYGARWMEYEEETVIDKPGHYEDDSWFEDVTKTKEIVPDLKITFKDKY